MVRVLIFAGGSGTRLKTENALPKQFLKINGKEIILHTIEKFEKNPMVDDIVVVCINGWEGFLQHILLLDGIKKVSKILTGGATGFESREIGLNYLIQTSKDSKKDLVMIHDGVRPIIFQKTITDNINCAKKYGNAITYAPATETIVYRKENNAILDRNDCLLARAPQTFVVQDIYDFYKKVKEDKREDLVDSASVAVYCGCELNYVEGPAENIKVTTKNDFYCVEGLLKEYEDIE